MRIDEGTHGVSDRLLHDLPETGHILGNTGRSTLYELIGKGQIKTVKIGRRTFVPHDELERYVATLKPDR